MSSKISYREINALAIPAIFAGIVEPLISLTDTAVAGRLPLNPDEALGAIGLVGSFLSAMIWIFLQTSNAISALVSHGVGQERVNRLKPLVSQLLYFNLLISLILSTTAFLLADEIFRLYGAENQLLEVCVRYFHIRVWGFPLTLLTFTIFGVFRGYQNTSWSMRIAFVGGLLNVLLDLLLVFVFDFNVEGIAWASLSAQWVMFVLALIYMYQKTPFRLNYIWPLHPDFKKTLTMSFDLFLRTLSLNIALFLAFRFATVLGGEGENQFVGAHALLIQVWLFSSFLLDGYAHAGSAISGKLFGAKNLVQLKNLVLDLVKIMLVLGVTLGSIYLVFYYPIGRFLTKSDAVLGVFFNAFWIVALMQPLNAVAFLLDGVYKGLGKTKLLRNVFVIALLIGFIPAMYLFRSLDLGMVGIWFSFMIWMLFRAGGLAIHFYKNYYKNP
ncbi:MATE family efflux transporter [Flavobacteriaceae bacterium Ap0902]|nr:MATE family efflux transporter [Flavobacteriaceae bacterium Ap0902]